MKKIKFRQNEWKETKLVIKRQPITPFIFLYPSKNDLPKDWNSRILKEAEGASRS